MESGAICKSGTTSISESGVSSCNSGVMTSSGSYESGATSSCNSGVTTSSGCCEFGMASSMVGSGGSGRRVEQEGKLARKVEID
jgi:hypothetical protein